MGRYTSASHKRPVPNPERPHAVWRGIGCLIILIVPIISCAAGYITMQVAIDNRWPLPYPLMGYPVVPALFWKVGALIPLWVFIQSQNNLYLLIAFTIAFIAVLGILVSITYAITYRFVAPPRYGPLDEPPPNIKVKRYKR